ncbi:hypothetical protein CPT03_13985 [Pedobacter ginsengisoli]|uniref:Glycosyltransferase RgtA/B/C/D-like domain-containing protein n=1 Tax=Pedobacter ginsengisoli TaxID=363852 RepID=A0A2D1U7D6_9SPHI|nr:glycosyltransferase family 39 protein [Pedobacter ginsengisoli]ATP57502.1 hypothetical protein CPT03_13985 [Pedobacter ginsengisoli]
MNKNINAPLRSKTLSMLKGFIYTNKTILTIIFLIFISILVYFPVIWHKFQMHWDDQWVVINAYTEDGLTSDNLLAILTEFYNGQYAPANQLSYTLLYSAFGYNPFWFHLFGLVIHISNVILVYFFIKRLLNLTKSFKITSVQRIALLTATIMALHPFLVESVAWLSASKILIYSFFYLSAIHFYLNYITAPRIKHYLLMVVFFILSFAGKEQAVTLPVCLLLIDYALKRNFRDKRLWLEKLPLFVLAFFFGYITLLSQSADKAGLLSEAPHYPFYQNIIFASYSVTEYLVKCLIPVKLSYLYVFPNAIGREVPVRFWMYPVMLLIICLSFWSFWKKHWVFFGISFFIIHLGVCLHIIPISRFAIVADRYVYIAAVGIFFLMAYFIDRALNHAKYKNLTIVLSFLYLLSIGTYAHQRSKVWHDSELLKRELKELLKKRNEFQKHKVIK